MGYIRGFVHGTVVGTVVGLCVAPQQGKRTREQLSAFGNAAKDGYGVAQRTMHHVAPLAGAAFDVVRGQVSRSKHEVHEEDIGTDPNVRIHHETNGRHR